MSGDVGCSLEPLFIGTLRLRFRRVFYVVIIHSFHAITFVAILFC